MSRKGEKNQSVTVDEIISLLLRMKSGNSADELKNPIDNVALKPIVDAVNALTQHVQAQAQAIAVNSDIRASIAKTIVSFGVVAGFSIMASLSLGFLVSGMGKLAMISFVSALSFWLPKVVFRPMKYKMGALCLIIQSEIIAFVMSNFLGRDAELHYLLIVFMCMPFLIIESRRKIAIFLCLTFAILLFATLKITKHTFLTDVQVVLPPYLNVFIPTFTMILIALLLTWLLDAVDNLVIGQRTSLTIERQARARADEAYSLLKILVDNIPSAVFLKDIQDNFKVTLWNKAAERIFEIPKEVILGKSTFDLWPKEQADQYHLADMKVVNDNVAIDIPEESSHSKSRDTIYLHTKKLPIALHDDGLANYILCISDDITDYKMAMENVEKERVKGIRNAKLASLGEMSAGIAHEINNPLAIIAGAARALPRFSNDPEKMASRILAIQEGAERIAKIVKSLRKYSRSDDKSNLASHPLHEIVKEALVLTDANAKRHSLDIHLNVATECFVSCDEIEIEQVVINLINNAIDATKDLTTRWIRIDLFERDAQVILQIRDSGSGIPDPVQQRLFQPFFTTKSVGEGTGLGLSIVKGILDEHLATIRVLTADQNTCFELAFPKIEGEANAA